MKMLSELKQVRWDEFPQPSWNGPEEVPCALRALADTTQNDDYTSYHRLLYAIGNNHAGTYFPVALAVIRKRDADPTSSAASRVGMMRGDEHRSI